MYIPTNQSFKDNSSRQYLMANLYLKISAGTMRSRQSLWNGQCVSKIVFVIPQKQLLFLRVIAHVMSIDYVVIMLYAVL